MATTYINGVKLKKQGFGIKFSGKTEEFIEQLRGITNERGYFNLEVNERKEVGKYGDTHSLKVDDWQPTRGANMAAAPSAPSSPSDSSDALPF